MDLVKLKHETSGFYRGFLSDETKTSEGKFKVIFNFGIWLHHMKTKNSNSDNSSFFRQH